MVVLGPSRSVALGLTLAASAASTVPSVTHVVAHLNAAHGARALALASWPGMPGAAPAQRLADILARGPARAALAYLPTGGALTGLDRQAAALASLVGHGRFPGDRTYLLVQRGLLAELEGTGPTAERTRGHRGARALALAGCRVRVWDTRDSLLRHLVQAHAETTLLPRPLRTAQESLPALTR